MRTLVSVVALAVAVAGCTAQPAPRRHRITRPAIRRRRPATSMRHRRRRARATRSAMRAARLGWGKVAGAMLGGAAGGAIVSNVARGRGSAWRPRPA